MTPLKKKKSCASWLWLPLPGREENPRTVVFYGFSFLGEALNEDVLPEFARRWRERTGKRVKFITAFVADETW